MGNANFCCNAREDHYQSKAQQKQKIQFEIDDDQYHDTESYRKTIQSVIIQKPQLTFSEQMIQDIIDLMDEKKVPLNIENGWKCLNQTEQFTLYSFEWRKAEKQIVYIFRTSLKLKGTIKQYANIDIEEMIQINKKIEELKVIDENVEHGESIRYIAYKGVTLISSRDFVYLKTRQFENNNKKFIEAAKSIEDDRAYGEKKRTRAQINLAGQIVEQIDADTIQIQQFLDIDFRMNVSLSTLQKSIVKEFQKYYETLQNFI